MPPGNSLTLTALQLLRSNYLLNKTEELLAPCTLQQVLLFHLCMNFCICGIKLTSGSTPTAPSLAPRVQPAFPSKQERRHCLSHWKAENGSLAVNGPNAETEASCPLEDSSAVSPEEREGILSCHVHRGTSQAICHSRHVSVFGGMG